MLPGIIAENRLKRVPRVGHVYTAQTHEIVRSYLTGRPTIWQNVRAGDVPGHGSPFAAKQEVARHDAVSARRDIRRCWACDGAVV